MYDEPWEDSEELADRLGEWLLGLVKSELQPMEYLLWADRPAVPPGVRIPFIPALFVSVVAGLSGFSLAAMFGLVGQGWMDLRTMILALGLGPLVLGGMIVAHLISLGVRRWFKRRKLAERLVYAVTDHRAIVGRVEAGSGAMEAFSVRPGEVVDTRRFENPDGSGDLFFLGEGLDHWLPLGFLEVPRVGLVEMLARETLIDAEGDWWKSGASASPDPRAIVGETGFIHVIGEAIFMNGSHTHNYPKLHNAAWPGVVGKGGEGAEPSIDLDTMLDLTAAAEVDGVKFDGFDLFLYLPHINIDASDDEIKTLAGKATSRGLAIGSVVAPVWEPTGGGSAMDEGEGRKKFLEQVRKGCRIAKRLRELGARPYGVVRFDSACSPNDWFADPTGNQKKIAETFRQAGAIARDHGEKLAAEGEICWGGMHSWRAMVDLLERVGEPETVGFQADMAHTLLYTLGENAPEDRILPKDFDWKDHATLDTALKTLTAALRPWTLDFHVAQNDATVFGSCSHDHTGRHCLATDPKGKLDIPHHAGFWLRDETGKLTKKFRHLCWDGCMFPNAVMMEPQTWNDILAEMIRVRDAHGWQE